MVKKVSKPKASKVKAVVKINGRTYEAKGNTALEAIENLKPDERRGIGILNIIRDGVPMRDKILNRFKTNRLFNSAGLTRQIAVKQASQLFE